MKILTTKKELSLIAYIKGIKNENIRLKKENAALKNDVELLKSMIIGGFCDVDFPNTNEGSKTNYGNENISDILKN